MLSGCEASRSSINGYDHHSYGMFKPGSLIKQRDDITRFKSFAFVNAWKKACSSSGAVNLLVPEGKTYFLKSIRLNGPCKSILTVQIFGTLSASQKRSDYKDITKWITFDGLNSLSVDGGATGTVNGNGETWWQNSCKRNEAKGGSGTASNIIFQNIQMNNVKNPIIIDQDYCDKSKCTEQKSAVQVKNVVYRNISGTSASDIAITLNCSKNYPCQEIVLDKVNIKGGKGSCSNADVMDKGIVFPQCKST
ncbi:hypothetical protein Bca52824_092591 [Brassica carinata]|uniref:Polygalacturonase n=1 Tax=Brassica carinata TaxID=52824 RepID=A0A8X7NSG2_BRACI|nr:hypothetical protein Bca52824_092591 [Brassica carinata]